MIVGMGENDDEIVEVALRLRELEIASIPINYLIPIEGNPIQTDHSITPGRALRILAMFRLANPSAEIRIAAGREGHLGAMELARPLPSQLALRRGLSDDAGTSGERHLQDDPRRRIHGLARGRLADLLGGARCGPGLPRRELGRHPQAGGRPSPSPS